MIDEGFRKLARFQEKRPLLVVILVLLVTLISLGGTYNIKIESSMTKMMPQNIESIKTMNIVEDEFGGSDSYTIVIQTSPNHADSNDVTDIRDPRVMEYADLISKKISWEEGITSVSSILDYLKAQNNGVLPKSKTEINKILQSFQTQKYVSKEYDLMIIGAKTSFTANQKEKQNALLQRIKEILVETNSPPGIKTGVTGPLAISAEVHNSIGPDMDKITKISMIGILICVCITFVSIRYGLTTLIPVTFGVIWAFGLTGYTGLEINTTMVGAASIMLGLGVDFGIQATNRFRQEIKENPLDKAIENTIVGTGRPILTTGTAATIGFSALLLGEIPALHGLGLLMVYGVIFCVLATFIILPAVLILEERYFVKNNKK